jgi:hypothetical protein
LDDVLSSELRIPTTHPCLSLLHLNHHIFPNKAPYAMPGAEQAVSFQGPKSRMYTQQFEKLTTVERISCIGIVETCNRRRSKIEDR